MKRMSNQMGGFMNQEPLKIECMRCANLMRPLKIHRSPFDRFLTPNIMRTEDYMGTVSQAVSTNGRTEVSTDSDPMARSHGTGNQCRHRGHYY